MKLFPSIFLCLIFLSSCQQEESISEFDLLVNPEVTELSESPEITNLDQLTLPVPEVDPFEIQLQWTSYITAIILIHHPDVANDVNNMIGVSGNVIPINSLLEPGTVGGDNSFKNLFWNYLNLYFHAGRPNHPIIIPPFSEEGPSLELFRGDVIEFITTITEVECVELYFPKGQLLLEAPLKFTSTAHPLTTALSNYGYERELSELDPLESYSTYVKSVHIFYVAANENIILARPFRNVTDCLYDQYPGILFEDYLNN